ncbi:MAG: 50S ribosomal protein L18 [Elusimicrobia bacterium]|nr:50S ribosomal protein L18 [Elusimicrobiota bacterium]
MKTKTERYEYRRERTRERLAEHANGRPRLSVHRSLKYLYAQVIDDAQGKTLAFASTLSKELKARCPKSGKNLEAAKALGQLIAEKALKVGVKQVAFDRGGLVYHGRVKAVAEAARQAGLDF